jgi:arsenate reductase
MALPTGDRPLLLHNPRCSKSRAAKALLEERGVAFDERRYLEDPLSREELEELARRLGRPAGEWIRKGEGAYAEAGLTEASSDEERLRALAAHPILLERPILVRGARAVVGRPPERLLELL